MIPILASSTADGIWQAAAAWVAVSYLLGAVPFGLCAGFLFRGIDIREKGSGNIGATNAIRLLGKPIGLTVFVLDFLKGFGPVMLVLTLGPPLVPEGADPYLLGICCGAAAMVGHIFPVYLKFRGGKGVASLSGAIMALRWDAALIAFAVFFIVRKLTRYVAVSSMALSIAFPLAVMALHFDRAFDEYLWLTVGGGLAAVLVIVRHSSNIGRLLRGEEDKVGDREPDRVE